MPDATTGIAWHRENRVPSSPARFYCVARTKYEVRSAKYEVRRIAYRDLFRAAETMRAATFAAEPNCSGVACRSALSSLLSMAML